jgi:hypothetical protein
MARKIITFKKLKLGGYRCKIELKNSTGKCLYASGKTKEAALGAAVMSSPEDFSATITTRYVVSDQTPKRKKKKG